MRRKTGFLTPTAIFSEALGNGAQVPFFINLAPNYDLTLRPAYLSRQGFLADVQWRHRLLTGSYSIRAGGDLRERARRVQPRRAARGLRRVPRRDRDARALRHQPALGVRLGRHAPVGQVLPGGLQPLRHERRDDPTAPSRSPPSTSQARARGRSSTRGATISRGCPRRTSRSSSRLSTRWSTTTGASPRRGRSAGRSDCRRT